MAFLLVSICAANTNRAVDIDEIILIVSNLEYQNANQAIIIEELREQLDADAKKSRKKAVKAGLIGGAIGAGVTGILIVIIRAALK